MKSSDACTTGARERGSEGAGVHARLVSEGLELPAKRNSKLAQTMATAAAAWKTHRPAAARNWDHRHRRTRLKGKTSTLRGSFTARRRTTRTRAIGRIRTAVSFARKSRPAT